MVENKNLSCKKTYELIQQTPIIHFQHDQSGATLRATEVKPKLDKFIIKKMGGEKNVNPNWFIDKKNTLDSNKESDRNNALNYKMQIVATGEPQFVNLGINTNYSIYYGNMGGGPKKRGVICNSKITIVSANSALLTEINNYIAEFFIIHNFGTMQGKGFGSYIINNANNNKEENKNNTINNKEYIASVLVNYYGMQRCYCFTCGTEKTFDNISKVYGVMKSGINHGSYHRSYLFEYFHGKGIPNKKAIPNEKAAMKEFEVAPSIVHPNKKWLFESGKIKSEDQLFTKQDVEKYKYVRALLGIGENIDFITKFVWDEEKNKWKPVKEDSGKVKISNKEIERLSSPIKFKVINNPNNKTSTVYMFCTPINPKIFSKEFKFENEGTGESITLSTPESKDFNLEDFLKYFVENYNKDSMKKDEKGKLPFYSIGEKGIEILEPNEKGEVK